MHRLKSNVTKAQINGALHQDEGIIINTVKGIEYSFVPLLYPTAESDGHLVVTGVVSWKGQTGIYETGAELHLYNPGTNNAYTELKRLDE